MEYRRGSSSKGDRWSFFRGFGTGWDSIKYRDGSRLIQFGNNPVKFVYTIKKGKTFPLFILGTGWITTFCRGCVRIGYTTKPKNFKVLWEASHAHRSTTRVRTSHEPSRLLL